MKTYTPVIGMEIHVELKTASKMFCGCMNDPFHAKEPNIYTCPVCLGMPGGLPVANKKAIEWTILLGHGLGSKIALFSKFDRKHYFYPDLAKSYQISQYDQPLCIGGEVETQQGIVELERIHLEEDTGKLQHTQIDGKKVTLVDFNRCGVPLVEIVTKPVITSSRQAKEYAKNIRDIVKALNISFADMEKGSMRLEANISLTDKPGVLPNYKVEVKNINSFKFLEQAIEFEIVRQKELLEKGETPAQETRGWNEGKGETVSQRSKEDAKDYRYFPDPDLPPLVFTQEYIDEVKSHLPLLPKEKKTYFTSLGIKESYVDLLVTEQYSWLDVDELNTLCSDNKLSLSDVIGAVVNKKVPYEGKTLKELVDAFKLLTSFSEVSEDVLTKAIEVVMSEQAKAVTDYKAGKTQVLGFLIGMVMKKVGKTDPKIIEQKIKEKLS